MTLLNGILAFGALAFTVPLAIHLLFRNRFRVLDWGAMHLLEAVVRINRRRLQLMHLLLLLLRCLIPILLAYCLARPVLTGFRVLPGDAPRTVVIVLDDSQSMAARDASGVTRMEMAKQSVEQFLESLSRRDELMLLRSSQLSSPVSSAGILETRETLREIRAKSGSVALGDLLRAAVEAAEQGVYPQRQIIVVGDFASDTLDDASMGAVSSLSGNLEEMPMRPAIGFLKIGEQTEQLANLSVDTIESNAAAVVAGRGGSFSATVRNASDLPLRDVRLTWYLDNVQVGQSLVTIAPRSTTVSKLTHRIDQVGVQVLTVSVEHADALLEDNRRSLALDVIDEINVLLVDGDPVQKALESETDYLAIALSPFAFGGEDQPDAVRTKVCLRQQLQNALMKEQPDLLALANVSKLTEQERAQLSEFVVGGGTLVIFDGDKVDPSGYNARWTSDAGSWQLPAVLGEIAGDPVGENRLQQPAGAHHSIYEPWESIRTGNEQPFADVEIFAYRKFSLLRDPSVISNDRNTAEESTTTNSLNSSDVGQGLGTDETLQSGAETLEMGAPITLWSLGNGDPVAVLARRGSGKVVQFSIPCDTEWTSLPLRLVFLPMIQQLVLDLAGNQEQVNVDVGDGLAIATKSLEPKLLSENQGVSESTLPEPNTSRQIDDKRDVQYGVRLPNGDELSLESTGGIFPRLILPSTIESGVYRFHAKTPIVDALPVQSETVRLASVPPTESVLRDADPERLNAAAELAGASLYRDVAALTSDDQQRRFGREIWRWLLALLLLALLGELLLQQKAVAKVSPVRSKMEAA